MPAMIRIGAGGYRKPKFVEGDLYDVCKRIKQIDPNLHVVLHEGHPQPWVVMENCIDGECRMVKRYAELDQRILGDLRRMLAIPFDERIKILDREVDEANTRNAHFLPDEAKEQFVWQMHRSLVDCNFMDPKWSKNMPLKPRK
jgi:hypothetical protein